jgi:hypothetical protein
MSAREHEALLKRAYEALAGFHADGACSECSVTPGVECPLLEDLDEDAKPEPPPKPDRCPYCSFQPTTASDYCDEHRPKAWR